MGTIARLGRVRRMMRQERRSLRAPNMATRPGEEGRFALSPRGRLMAGWIAAILIVAGIALAVGLLGGNGDGSGVAPVATGTPGPGDPLEITFGTELDPATGQVSAAAETSRFTSEDLFAYSVDQDGPPPDVVYVEVARTGGGPEGVVQAAEDADQRLPEGRSVIAFTVPADNLFDVFGAGEYVMRMYLDPAGEPIAEGTFELVAPMPTGSPSGT